MKLYDDYFDAEAGLVRVPFESPGYHSRVPSGTPVHPTNPSLCYALDLVCREDAASDERACAIIRKVLPLQDTNPISKTYGIWPWLYEEPISAMAPPDWNWADFCGFRLAEILLKAGDRLPTDLRDEMRAALFHAAGAIYRRNVGTHYTNICVMGGIVTTLAGEILDEPRLLDYGRRRLAQVVADHREAGGFNEYNSPTYTRVVLWDCDQALRCIRDAGALESVGYLFREMWKTVADHFHPATGQWAGPHSRDYTSFMTQEVSRYIAFKTGVDIHGDPGALVTTKVSPLTGWIMESRKDATAPTREFYSQTYFDPDGPVCPKEFIERFRDLPKPEYEIRERFVRREPEALSTCGVTWMHEEICLGSVNRDFFMDQRRAVLAFWNSDAKRPVSLRLRFMHDGREFSSACVANAQSGPRILSAVHLLLGQGDFHPTLDVPLNNLFSAEDFRLRYELRGEGIDAREENGTFVLSAGDWSAVVSPASGAFADAPVTWKISRGDGWVAVDAVCYEGARKKFPFAELPPVMLAAGLVLQRKGEPVKCEPPSMETDRQKSTFLFQEGDLKVTVPDHATPFLSDSTQ